MVLPSDSAPGVLYRLERRLGEGGTAVAYFAQREAPEGRSPAVVKVILPTVMQQAGDTARMVVQKEAVALGRLNERMPPCPFVVRLMDVGSLEYHARLGQSMSLPWLAIEYVHGGPQGTTLEERVRRSVEGAEFAFDPERAIRAITHITEGLQEIHEAGVIHRDLNPNNILCCSSGNSEMFKVSDFGIARPIGVQATFNSSVLGTPGYIPPEQATDEVGPVGYYSDIFSLGALTFYMLTGEHYLEARNVLQVIAHARNGQRRSLRSAPRLAPELRDDPATCEAIDAALAAATSPEPGRRPQNARAFANSIVPWLSGCPPTRRNLGPAMFAPRSEASRRLEVLVRHPMGHDWVLSRVGWDGDGHGLGASTRGLVYFDGSTWKDVPQQALGSGPLCFSTRVSAGRWLIGGEGGGVAEYARGGITRLLRPLDPSLTLIDASGDLADLTAMIGVMPGSPPLLCASSGGRWLKPLPVPGASALLGLAPVDDERWLVCGRSAEGKGLAAIYRPLFWSLEPFTPVETRALTACASRPERALTVAVGAGGVVLALERGRTLMTRVPSGSDLSSVAIDVLGGIWVGAAGELWFSEGTSLTFQRIWHDPSWRAPFVSIFADAGLVFAATADGAVLECRSTVSQLITS
jgi:eukaryotic-like serine/threonine-protein kinase